MITNTVHVKTSVEYDVIIGRGLLDSVGSIILNTCKSAPDRCFIVSDDTVFALYGDRVIRSATAAGLDISSFVFPHGEISKNTEVLLETLRAFKEAELTRSSLVIALGGGVVGDLTGFASSIYLRGVDFMQIPTTLLAAIDSSVGGKTAVNSEFGKNLLGSFHQPVSVVCDIDTFRTLPEEILADGMAEAVKYGAIRSPELLDILSSRKADLADVVARCVSIKAQVVENDEFDTGERMILNYGHTAAHSIEKLSSYSISHGRAVAMGMLIASAASDRLGLSVGCYERIKTSLAVWGLDAPCPYSAKELASLARLDKKRRSGTVTTVMLKDIGNTVLYPVALDGLENVLIP